MPNLGTWLSISPPLLARKTNSVHDGWRQRTSGIIAVGFSYNSSTYSIIRSEDTCRMTLQPSAAIAYFPPRSIFLKSSWPFPPPPLLPEVAEPPAAGAVEPCAVPRPLCLLPSPARGRETALRGTKKPEVAEGGAIGRDVGGPEEFSATICSVLPLNTIESGFSSSLPASCCAKTVSVIG